MEWCGAGFVVLPCGERQHRSVPSTHHLSIQSHILNYCHSLSRGFDQENQQDDLEIHAMPEYRIPKKTPHNFKELYWNKGY
jgi:hypothetical protein